MSDKASHCCSIFSLAPSIALLICLHIFLHRSVFSSRGEPMVFQFDVFLWKSEYHELRVFIQNVMLIYLLCRNINLYALFPLMV